MPDESDSGFYRVTQRTKPWWQTAYNSLIGVAMAAVIPSVLYGWTWVANANDVHEKQADIQVQQAEMMEQLGQLEQERQRRQAAAEARAAIKACMEAKDASGDDPMECVP